MQRTIKQLSDQFLYEQEFVRKLQPKTLKAYSMTIRLFLKVFPDIELPDITTNTVVSFFKHLQERRYIVGNGIVKAGIKKSTVATYWGKLNGFFNWLVANKYVAINPLSSLPYPSPNYEKKEYLEKAEVEKIIAAIYLHHSNDPLILKRNIALLYLFLFCGLRKGELLQLQIRDVDMEKKMLTIRGEISKTRRSRQIPLHSKALLHLREYLRERKRFKSPFLIISTKDDAPLSEDGLKHLVQKLCIRSQVHFHLHQLRHTFAMNFLSTTNNIAKLKQLLGHQNISTTLIYLRHLPVSEMKADIEMLHIDSFI